MKNGELLIGRTVSTNKNWSHTPGNHHQHKKKIFPSPPASGFHFTLTSNLLIRLYIHTTRIFDCLISDLVPLLAFPLSAPPWRVFQPGRHFSPIDRHPHSPFRRSVSYRPLVTEIQIQSTEKTSLAWRRPQTPLAPFAKFWHRLFWPLHRSCWSQIG